MIADTLTEITKEQKIAKDFFEKHPGAIKLSQKASSELSHSFIIDSNKQCFFAFSKEKLAGPNGESFSVKKTQDKDGKVGAVKIVALDTALNIDDMQEVKALKKLGRLHSAILRPLTEQKTHTIKDWATNKAYHYSINHKLYIIQDYIPGANLDDILSKDTLKAKYNLTQERILKLSILLTLRLKFLKDHHIVHGDLKPANIMVYAVAEDLFVELVDFGNAYCLTPTQTEIAVNYQGGSLFFRAPELSHKQTEGYILGHAGDVFSLGKILNDSLKLSLSEKAYSQMFLMNRKKRATIEDVLQLLFLRLESDFSQGKISDQQLCQWHALFHKHTNMQDLGSAIRATTTKAFINEPFESDTRTPDSSTSIVAQGSLPQQQFLIGHHRKLRRV